MRLLLTYLVVYVRTYLLVWLFLVTFPLALNHGPSPYFIPFVASQPSVTDLFGDPPGVDLVVGTTGRPLGPRVRRARLPRKKHRELRRRRLLRRPVDTAGSEGLVFGTPKCRPGPVTRKSWLSLLALRREIRSGHPKPQLFWSRRVRVCGSLSVRRLRTRSGRSTQ